MLKSLKFYAISKPGCPLQSVTMKSLYSNDNSNNNIFYLSETYNVLKLTMA